MSYNIRRSEGTEQQIDDGVIDQSKYTIGVVGRNATNYGKTIAETQVNILENFASESEPNLPIPGQLWYDKSSHKMKVNVGDLQANDTNPLGDNVKLWYTLLTTENNGGTDLGGIGDDAFANIYAENFHGDNFNGGVFTGSSFVGGDFSGENANFAGTLTAGSFSVDTLDVENAEFITVTATDFVGGAYTGTSYTGTASLSFIGNNAQLSGSIEADTYKSAGSGDVAERFEADKAYPAGTVVKIGGEKEVTQTDNAFCTDVFGVISENPSLRLNHDAGSDETHPYVAFSGRVEVLIAGAVKKGARVVASATPGVAIQPTDEELEKLNVFNVIGRALDSSDDLGIKRVWIAVGAK